jgi:hypothetical protein
MRRASISAAILLCIARLGFAQAKPQPLNPELHIRLETDTLDHLKAAAKPDFVWGCDRHELAWVEHDSAGKPIFAFNKAYALTLKPGRVGWYLLEATADFCSDRNIDYTRFVDGHPKIIARDPVGGVVYQATWPGPGYASASDAEHDYRTLFFLCDGNHKWHLLGEAPECGSSRIAGRGSEERRLVPAVRWKLGANPSAEVNVTTIYADRGDPDAAGRPDPLDIEMRVPTPAGQDSLDGTDEAGNWQAAYVLIEKPEPIDSLVLRIAEHYADLPDESKPADRAAAIRSVKAAVLKINPDLPAKVRVSKRVRLPNLG